MTIEIYESTENGCRVFDRYTVILHGHIYTMSSDPGSPKGACIYQGTQHNVDIAEYLQSNNVKIDFDALPAAVQNKINQLLKILQSSKKEAKP